MTHVTIWSQSSINDYKYVIIPTQYEFLKEKDQYQINSLTKFLFNKYGYEAYMQDENLPVDLQNNRCLGLLADVVKDGGLFKTKLKIDLKDCNGNIIVSSQTGETREKEYSKAYNLALRDAFTTFQAMDYSYQPNKTIQVKKANSNAIADSSEQEEIDRLKNELKALKEAKKENAEIEKIEVAPTMAIKQDSKQIESVVAKESFKVLYAQFIENGFQLVDSTPKVVMVIISTGANDVFMVKDQKAIVYKKDGKWWYSKTDGDQVDLTELNIKF